MQLICTKDGVLSWKLETKTIWCASFKDAVEVGWENSKNLLSDLSEEEFTAEMNYAIDTMRSKNHNRAEFGIYGTFMFTTQE
jgi:hypothetical protein